jgi:acyl-coenzyme A thioesterase PaaI-like protein
VGFPIIASRPDPLFGIEDVAWAEPRVTARMRVGPRLLDAAGRSSPGALGVVADNVLGYAIIATAPAGGRAVTTEMSVDVLGPLPGL